MNDNFTSRKNPIDKDLWKINVVKTEEQQYLNKDYSKNLKWVFPLFSKDTISPNEVSKDEKNEEIQNRVAKGEGINWDNQTLSYAKKNVPGKQQYKAIFLHTAKNIKNTKKEKNTLWINVLDLTANIGNDSINFALFPEVKQVSSFEMQEKPYEMFKNNVKLYGPPVESKIHIYNSKFDVKLLEYFDKLFKSPIKKQDCNLCLIDPPFEADNNSGNFNFSIGDSPIEFIIDKLLEYVDAVFLNMPLVFKYNLLLGDTPHNHNVKVYLIGKKNIKIYAITKGKKSSVEGYRLISGYGDTLEELYKYKVKKLF